MNKPVLTMVIPTFNEVNNLPILINAILGHFEANNIRGEIVIVDDDSPDGTWKVAEDLKSLYRDKMQVLKRKYKKGLSSAVIDGFEISRGEVLGVMDADLSHPVEKIADMHNRLKDSSADMVIGSRYVQDVGIEGLNFKRKIISKFATLLAKPLVSIKDPMSGFFMIKKRVIENKKLNPLGFKIGLEILVKGNHYGSPIEIPIVFANRMSGESKLSEEVVFQYLSQVFSLLGYKYSRILQFVKFCLVGLSGVFVNLTVYTIMLNIFSLFYLLSATISFLFAVTTNLFLNKLWTFHDKKKIGFNAIFKGIKFLLVSLGGYGINISILYVLVDKFNLDKILSQLIAITAVTFFNFFGNIKWTFGWKK